MYMHVQNGFVYSLGLESLSGQKPYLNNLSSYQDVNGALICREKISNFGNTTVEDSVKAEDNEYHMTHDINYPLMLILKKKQISEHGKYN